MVNIFQKVISDRLGISRQAVSYALNGRPGVGAETRQRVLDEAHALGYRPSAAARAMQRGTFRALGVLGSPSGPISNVPEGVLYGMQEQVREKDYHLVVGHLLDPDFRNPEHLPRVLREWMVDGLVVSYIMDRPNEFVAALERWRVKSVWINVKEPQDAVRPDDIGSALQVTRELIAMGHRRVAYLEHPSGGEKHYSVDDRIAGYRKAMEETRLLPVLLSPPLWDPNAHNMSRPVAWARTWLREIGAQRPTAIVAYSRDDARWFAEAAAAEGLRVPHDLSVIGYADRTWVRDSALEWGALVLPHEKIGRALVDMLLAKIEQDTGPMPTLAVPVPIVWGDTVTPPVQARKKTKKRKES